MNNEREYIPDPALTTLKDKKKALRSVLQAFAILALLLLLLSAIIDYPKYDPYDRQDASVVSGADNGFIAVSYFGVSRVADEDVISVADLEKQLKALQASGYVTISQEDLFKYYDSGRPLPDRALFLMLEDGRRDTAIMMQPLLEDLNMRATTLTYANNLTERGSKFLTTRDLKELLRSSYWEDGTNGYRLSYINVFDRYERFLGEMTAHEFSLTNQYLGRDYNHYLMDFIRDKNDLPLESYSGMTERVRADYDLMDRVYKEEIGRLPPLYVLMHANTGAFATNDRVSDVNEQAIYAEFQANFNREGYSRNDRATSRYDLTRIQPQSYWSANHLLMRLWYDTGLPMAFVQGDAQRAAGWTVLNGAAEFQSEKILLTSLPSGVGTLRLNGSEGYGDVSLTCKLTGNKLGTQRIRLRASGSADGLVIELRDDVLYIYANDAALFSAPMDTILGVKHQTVGENSEEARKAALDAKKRYGEETAENYEIITELKAEKTAADSEEYIPALDLRTAGSYAFAVELTGSRLTVRVDGKTAVEDLQVDCAGAGSVFLESASGSVEGGYSQRNLADDVYDGVFENLCIRSGDAVLYDYRPGGWELFKLRARTAWDGVINWFITNL